jgi:hypothetical protein
MGSAPTKTHIPNRNGTKKSSAVYQARIFKRSWDSNINPARTGTSSTPRKAQNITPASLQQNNPPEGSHTITTIFTKTYKNESTIPSKKIRIRIGSTGDQRKHSFFVRTIKDWNDLPPDILGIDDYEAFKISLIVHRSQ